MVDVSKWIERSLTLTTYNLVVEIVFLILLLVLIAGLLKQFRISTANRKLEFTYLFISVVLVIVHSRFMFDSNIEVIHSLEFSLLAFLIFPFTKRFGASVFFTLPFMLADEWYQFTILYPYLDYYDMNDILMDTYGCGLTMTVLMILGVKGQTQIQPLWKRTEFISLVALLLIVLLGVKLCVIALYSGDVCSNTLLVINEGIGPEPFYRLHPTHRIWFHVMKPAEGFLAIGFLHFFYLGLDSLRQHSA